MDDNWPSESDGNVNRVMLIGHLGRDPEVRRLESGDKVVNFSMATNDRWRDPATGERRETTWWHYVKVFGKLADVAEEYLHKGSYVYVAGKLRTRTWRAQDGEDRQTTEVVLSGFGSELNMLDNKGDNNDRGRSDGDGGYGRRSYGMSKGEAMGRPPLDDDIPF